MNKKPPFWKNTGWWIGTLVIVGVLLSFAYCVYLDHTPDKKYPDVSGRIDNVVAVYMHEYDAYSIKIQDGIEIKSRNLGNTFGDSKIFADVPDGQPMFVEYVFEHKYNKDNISRAHYIIHIHGVQDINGAGWNRGKFGSGETQIIAK